MQGINLIATKSAQFSPRESQSSGKGWPQTCFCHSKKNVKLHDAFCNM